MKHLKRIKRLPAAVYNFFNMFHKDEGAHFTYNMGVSMMRAGMLCFFAAIVVLLLYVFVDGSYITKIDTVTAEISYCTVPDPGIPVGKVRFSGADSSGKSFSHEQTCTWNGCRHYTEIRESERSCEFERYSVKEDSKYFISYHRPFLARYEYYLSHPGTRAPVPIWLIPVALILMVIFFLIGRRQIHIAMKYPRTDVPDEISGAPVVYTDTTEYGEMYQDRAEEACSYDQLLQKRLQ